MIVLKGMIATGYLASTAGILSQVVPSVPEDFKSWPVTAIAGLIALGSMGLNAYVNRLHAKVQESNSEAQVKAAEALGKVGEQQATTNQRLEELGAKLGNTNDRLLEMGTELRSRPCIRQRPDV
jgi:HEAT repeat protein